MLLKKKNTLLFGILGGSSLALSLIPLWNDIHKMFSSSGRIFRKRNIYPRFVLGANENGRELNVEAKELLDKRVSGQTISFGDVKLKWGYRRLNENDMLISICDKSSYFLATHVWGSQYMLENGKKFDLSEDICSSISNLKNIDINFVPESGGTSNTKLAITFKDCSFKWNNVVEKSPNSWNLTMTCQGKKKEDGKGWIEGEKVTLTLKIDSYKLEYNPERKSKLQKKDER